MKQIYLSVSLLFCLFGLAAQPVIYKDAQTLITGTWAGAGTGGTATLTEVTGQTPFEGNKHYRFDYNFLEYWAGTGLNMDNWGGGAARNFSGFSHLRIAYRGLSAGQTLTITLRDGNNFGNTMEVGPPVSTYTVVDIPMIALTAGSPVNASAVREIDLSISSTNQAGSGMFYVDGIELVNVAGGPAPASAVTMARAASMGNGVNTSNWLEAYWLLPFNAYPEFSKYNRTLVRDLKLAGFNTFRLPVIFERLGSQTPPYDLDFNHVAFDLVDSMILWAGIYNFKLIIDNHHGYPLTDANYNAELPRLRAVWGQLVDRYDYLDPSQFFFEIYNEPTNEISNTNWHTVAVELMEEIRLHETQTHSVLMGANLWNSGNALIGFTPLADPDIIYTFHNYDPFLFTHQGFAWTSPPYFPARAFPQSGEVAAINQVFAAVKAWSDNYEVPVCLGEFGCSTEADATSRCNWIQTLTNAINTNGFSAFYWDAISPDESFGFFNNGIINEANCIPCFKTALGLFPSLPITLTVFSVDCANGRPNFKWEAYTSEAGNLFDLEYSNDGTNWAILKRINALTGTQVYQQSDENPTAARFYRLKMIDPDQKITYSNLLEPKCLTIKNKLVVFPNPAAEQTTISLEGNTVIEKFEVFDAAGKLLISRHFDPAALQKKVEINVRILPAGTYTITVTDSAGERFNEQVSIGH